MDVLQAAVRNSIIALSKKKKKKTSIYMEIFFHLVYEYAGLLYDNPTVINGSSSKGWLINAEAGIEHIWIFCGNYWKIQETCR